jgi:hypothetical protein
MEINDFASETLIITRAVGVKRVSLISGANQHYKGLMRRAIPQDIPNHSRRAFSVRVCRIAYQLGWGVT